ncbi:hypothetical protein GCM10023091_13080 [Ravibacter arvi]|uniref:Uncharacterized protein n=1 Tax=Ravibacter arvi TaxID=2051041 RepID=A0ABP8LSR8_9BACT
MGGTTKHTLLFAVAALSPVVFYLAYAWHFSGTLFYADDFHLLKSVQWGKEADDLTEKIRLLYQQHQEHRIIIPRLLTLLDYFAEGHINWKTLILIANILWCSTIFLLWKAFASLNLNRWYFLPVPWLLLHPQYYENVNWAISILQQSDVVFLFTLLAYLCARRRYNPAIIVAVVATFTHGNGIFAFPIAIIFAALDKDWKSAIRLIIVMVLVAAFYFIDFRAGQNASISKSLSDPANLVRSFGVFFGGITLIIARNYTLAAAVGLAGIGFLIGRSVISLKKSFHAPVNALMFDRMVWGITAFLVITGSLVVATRSWTGVESIAAPRYLHYTSFVCAVIYLCLLSLTTTGIGALTGGPLRRKVIPTVAEGSPAPGTQPLSKDIFLTTGDPSASLRSVQDDPPDDILRLTGPQGRKLIPLIATPAAVLLCLVSYLNFTPKVRFLRDQLVADEANYLAHGVFLQYFPSFNDNIREPYANAVKSGVIQMTDKISDKIATQERYGGPQLAVASDSMRLEDANRSVSVRSARITGVYSPGSSFFIVLRLDGEKPYWVPAYVERAAYRSMLGSGALLGEKFEGNVILNNLPPGRYQLGLFTNNRLLWSDQHLEVRRE